MNGGRTIGGGEAWSERDMSGRPQGYGSWAMSLRPERKCRGSSLASAYEAGVRLRIPARVQCTPARQLVKSAATTGYRSLLGTLAPG